jgi:hypothetical protein
MSIGCFNGGLFNEPTFNDFDDSESAGIYVRTSSFVNYVVDILANNLYTNSDIDSILYVYRI